MKVTFVRPNLADVRSRDALEPYVFAILSGLTPPDVERVLHDERLGPIPVDEPTDLVALTVETFNARRAYQLAERYRRRGVPVVLGGYHPTLAPAEAAEHATSVVVGDAETTWPQVVADARSGTLQRFYRARSPSLRHMVIDRSVFSGKAYGRPAIVQYGRGCRFACDFCSIRAFYRGQIEHRRIDDVIAEIDDLAGRPVFFADDNIFSDRKTALELFSALRPLGIRWVCQVSLDVTDDQALVRAMAESGCICAIVGFESLEKRNLAQMNKTWNRGRERYQRAVRVFRDHGIMVYGTFVCGYDHDTPQTVRACLDFAMENRLMLANFNPLMPTPGTQLFSRLQEEGRLIHDRWWLDPEFRYGQVPFHPRGMSAGALEAACYEARLRFNSITSIGKRAIGVPPGARWFAGQAIHWAANLVSRWEIRRKQGMPLGAREGPNG